MIHQIEGTVIATDNQIITVLPEGSGISFGIFVPQQSSYTIGKVAKLYTHMHWNQEQGPTLFGFTSQLERNIFLLIISCSGIGPKIGLATLETMGPEQFVAAIHEENISAISSIPGIGKKKAEQIIVGLKHKVQNLINSGLQLEGATSIKHWQQVSEVLTSLNYSRQEINQAIQHLKGEQNVPEISFDVLLRKALSFLSKLR